ncbi:hypothetical protein A3715_18280 [Oleiphilus sp. HI0009]|nr:hypothetical protein A3715_18280 [Oleiphilus sp. HI0009]
MKTKEENLALFNDVICTDRTGNNPAGFNFSDNSKSKFKASKEIIKETIQEKHGFVYVSFGKDSSCVLHLALMAMRELDAEGVEYKKAFFLTSNTLMESPVMNAYVFEEVAKLNAYIKEHGINAEHRMVFPTIYENNLVNAIGGRIMIPTASMQASCSEDMKISPMNREKTKIAKELGYSRSEAQELFVGVLGTRFDESRQREENMKSRGEKAHEIVKQYDKKNPSKWGYMISPIAVWGVMDVYSHIAVAGRKNNEDRASYIESHPYPSFTDYKTMIEIYRDSNSSGSCGLLEGGSNSSGCGARHGCFVCLKSGVKDKSMEAMLEKEEHQWMKPLNHFRNLVGVYSNDPSKRVYINRSINEDGNIIVAPNGYSPEMCEDMLKWILTIQMNELEHAEANNTSPRFWYIGEKEVIAIDFLWAKSGHHAPLEASKIWNDVVNNNIKYEMPEMPVVAFTAISNFKSVEVPFADEEFMSSINGAFDMDAATAGYWGYSVNDQELRFSVDQEGAELFMGFELDNALKSYRNACPSSTVHYLMRMGVVSIKKGGASKLDASLRMAQQIYRHDVRDILSNPVKLTDTLVSKMNRSAMVKKGAQLELLAI